MKTGQGNPCDIWPAIENRGGVVIFDIIKALDKDENVDCIILTMVATRHREWNIINNKLFMEILKTFKKPIFIWIFGDYFQFNEIKKVFREYKIPVFDSIESLTKILSRIVDYTEYIKKLKKFEPKFE